MSWWSRMKTSCAGKGVEDMGQSRQLVEEMIRRQASLYWSMRSIR